MTNKNNLDYRCQYTYQRGIKYGVKCNYDCKVSDDVIGSDTYCRMCIKKTGVKRSIAYQIKKLRQRRDKTLKTVLYLCCLAKFKSRVDIELTKESIINIAKHLWKTRKDPCWDTNNIVSKCCHLHILS